MNGVPLDNRLVVLDVDAMAVWVGVGVGVGICFGRQEHETVRGIGTNERKSGAE